MHNIEERLQHLHEMLHKITESQLSSVAWQKEISHKMEKIMSAISDFADKMKAHNDKVDAAVSGISGDLDNLKAQITALQNSAGQITPADQALLDGIEAKAAAVADKVSALDALTPPVVPPGV
jgi:predicted  nucleic acid-binding Zn-ribbon protein